MAGTATGAMTREEMDRVVDAHFEAEARGDIDAILDTFTEDIEHDSAGNPEGPLHGKAAAAVFYNMLFGELTIEGYRPVRRLYGDMHLVDETLVQATAVGRPFGLEGRGRRVEFRLLHVFEFANGLIHRENGWVDIGGLAQQLQ